MVLKILTKEEQTAFGPQILELLTASDQRAIVIKSSLIPLMSTRTSNGVTLMSLKKGETLTGATVNPEEFPEDAKGLKKIKIPATGVLLNKK